MVWRYHPGTHAYEVFAEGGGNTFGIEIDGEGRLFSGHNGGQTRGWHFMQNGFYLKQDKDPQILVVDDEPAQRQLLAGSLGKDYTVVVAANGSGRSSPSRPPRCLACRAAAR